ncbi:MAG: MBL fold metallo-hydrolase [Phycisphaerales bacterium]
MTSPPSPTNDAAPRRDGFALRVLASGSRGNCSVLVSGGSPRRVTLIDAGLSPSRTRRHLADVGILPHEVDDIVFTHLDSDHCHPGWVSALRGRLWHARVRLLHRHRGRAERMGMLTSPTELFDEDGFELGATRAHPVVMAHDSLGVAAFRFALDSDAGVAELGFATDVGRVTSGLIEHMRGVGVLAIESNYCPQLQQSSGRPAFLKRRIMGGSGHLSNQECADAVARIEPREHVVFLHLSQECNRPALVSAEHAGGDVAFTISDQHRPTRWVPIPALPPVARTAPVVTGNLFTQSRPGSVA